MVQENEKILSNVSAQNMDDWFDELIAHITTDKLLLETDTASTDKVKFYKTMMSGNEADVFGLTRSTTTMYFLKNLLVDYVQVLNKSKANPLHLALDLSDSKILVWAEIRDDDVVSEDNLILTEAELNAKYAKYGFYISSTIVETSDGAVIPPHYKKIK